MRRREGSVHLVLDAPIAHDESQSEGIVEGVPIISKGQDFNTAVVKEAIIELHSDHMEFTKF